MSDLSLKKLYAGDRRTLSRSITLIESLRESDRREARALLEEALPRTGRSLRIGITGPPGVGKSTFIDVLGMHLVGSGWKVSVLAIDPSSPRGGGSILGDKTRMEALSREPNAYIRPSPACDSLGGVAHKTRETLLLCEAAGFDVVLVETVGVGQSEVDVASMVDFFAVLLMPNAGDELQGIKRGIIELADAVVVNKADGEFVAAAERTRSQYQGALKLFSHAATWSPPVLTCSAQDETNIDKFWAMIDEFRAVTQASGEFERKRSQQNAAWLKKLLHELYDRRLLDNARVRDAFPGIEQHVLEGRMTPFAAANRLDELLG